MRTPLLVSVLIAATIGCGGSTDEAGAADAGLPDGGLQTDGGATPGQLGPCSIEKRQTSDQTLLYRETRTYDELGRLATLSQDGGWLYWEADFDIKVLPDGDLDRINYYSYDSQGRVTLYERDNDADGVIEFVRYQYYDADTGKLLYNLTDGNIQDGFAATSQWNYRHNAEGQHVETVHDPSPDGMLHFDKVADATLNHQWIYNYDADGLRTTSVWDRGFDATINQIITHVYDENDRLIRVDLDGHSQDNSITADMVIDIAVHYDYDDQGRITNRRYDDGNDGSIDRREDRSYDCE